MTAISRDPDSASDNTISSPGCQQNLRNGGFALPQLRLIGGFALLARRRVLGSPTPLYEGRPHGRARRFAACHCFDPRPCTRGDHPPTTSNHPYHIVSIHAPVRGATSIVAQHPPYLAVSIHAPVRGATRVRASLEVLEQVSIHAPVRGATCLPTRSAARPMRFRSTPLYEGRLVEPCIKATSEFRSTPLYEGRPARS